jgi:ATP-binding protein involved in chromosome partitioning
LADPRINVINKRLSKINRIIAVSSGKGGVGKSMIATTLALELHEQGNKVGLLDIDFTSPSTHTILGVKNVQPKEDKGLIPPQVYGLEYMSLIYFSGDQAAPLRGEDTSNALIELLAVTIWSDLDYLVIDMPPGIGDAVLDLVRLVPRIEFLIITTPSQLAFQTVKKLVILLRELNITILGIVENMKMNNGQEIKKKTEELEIGLLASITYDSKVEESIGNTRKIKETNISQKIKEVIKSTF